MLRSKYPGLLKASITPHKIGLPFNRWVSLPRSPLNSFTFSLSVLSRRKALKLVSFKGNGPFPDKHLVVSKQAASKKIRGNPYEMVKLNVGKNDCQVILRWGHENCGANTQRVICNCHFCKSVINFLLSTGISTVYGKCPRNAIGK